MDRLVIADPSLVDRRGHHYHLTRTLTVAAMSCGLRVEWLVNESYQLTAEDSGVKVHPAFSFTMYDRYKALSGSPALSGDNICAQVRSSIDSLCLANTDHILFHTAFFDVYEAFAHYFTHDSSRAGPIIHLCTPYDQATMPGRIDSQSVIEVLSRIATAANSTERLYLWTETPSLAEHYSSTIGADFQPLALPSPVDIAKLSLRMQRPNSRVSVVYAGAAREEKGFTKLPDLIDRCLSDQFVNGRVAFSIQATPQIVGYNDNILRAIERLNSLGVDAVDVIKHSLGEAEYHALLRGSDLVLLLYDEDGYRIRGSGIAVEAVSLGKCLVATKGTFGASLITHGGGAAVTSTEEAYRFIVDYCRRPWIYRMRGMQQAFEYNRAHNSSTYISRLVFRSKQKNEEWISPSSLIGVDPPRLIS